MAEGVEFEDQNLPGKVWDDGRQKADGELWIADLEAADRWGM
jgi:hypothetical protein